MLFHEKGEMDLEEILAPVNVWNFQTLHLGDPIHTPDWSKRLAKVCTRESRDIAQRPTELNIKGFGVQVLAILTAYSVELLA